MNIGLCYQHEGKYIEATEKYERALKIKEGVLGEGHIDVLEIMVNIGFLHHLLGSDDVALERYE